jgi:myo-inositol 2-dehydrogenase/D-chiro-inositol 1-dehydrogenase
VLTHNETADRHVYGNAEGMHSAKPLYFFLERYAQSFVDELQVFIDCLQKGACPPVTGLDGRIPVTMAMAATQSLKEHRPVKLSEIG